MTFDNVKETPMNEEQAATAVYQTIQTVKKHIGSEKTVGMVLGAIIGETMMAGGTKEDLLRVCGQSWDALQKMKDERAGA